MSESKVIIYRECKLLSDKNFVLDNPGGSNPMLLYLETLGKMTFTKFQYIKNKLSAYIDVELSQEEFEMGKSANDWNYVHIVNGTTGTYFFYFVDRIEWRSQNTARFILLMDTLNTFRYGLHYKVSKKTLVNRMHKDRFKDRTEYKFTINIKVNKTEPLNQTFYIPNNITLQYTTNVVVYSYTKIAYESSSNASVSSVTIDNGFIKIVTGSGSPGIISVNVVLYVNSTCGMLVKLVDPKSEQISSPVYKTSEDELRENVGQELTDWRVLYRNKSDSSVGCYLVPTSSISASTIGANGTLNQTQFTNDGYYYHFVTYQDEQVTFVASDRKVSSVMGENNRWIVIHKHNSVIDLYTYTNNSNPLVASNLSEVEIESIATYVKFYYSASVIAYATLEAVYKTPDNATTTYIVTFSPTTRVLDNVIDKSLSTNIKLIDPPYSPTKFKVETGNLVVRDPWLYDTDEDMLIYDGSDTGFSNDVETDVKGIYTRLTDRKDTYDFTGTASRFFKDPKLLHSDFYRLKFVYDSFSKVFPYELLEYNPEASWDFAFNFKMSRNITSKFLFTFNELKWKKALEDYPNILPVARNNEEVLYSSQYLDYLRNGYNFDLKAKERDQVVGGTGIALTMASLVASIGLSATPVGAVGVVTAGLSLTQQIINYAKTTAQNEENIDRKLQESRNQAVSVLNNDDFDLFKAYSNNKAKLVEYKVSEAMEHALDDLFYYAGYSVNEQMIPTTDSRYWFNFVQCDLVVNETDNISDECMNDIIERFKQGVTFLHYRNSTFDFAQEKENLEVDLVTPPTP